MTDSSMKPFRPTFGHVIATIAIFVAAAALIALFMVPIQNSWFWPTVGMFVVATAIGLLAPLPPRSSSSQDHRP